MQVPTFGSLDRADSGRASVIDGMPDLETNQPNLEACTANSGTHQFLVKRIDGGIESCLCRNAPNRISIIGGVVWTAQLY